MSDAGQTTYSVQLDIENVKQEVLNAERAIEDARKRVESKPFQIKLAVAQQDIEKAIKPIQDRLNQAFKVKLDLADISQQWNQVVQRLSATRVKVKVDFDTNGGAPGVGTFAAGAATGGISTIADIALAATALKSPARPTVRIAPYGGGPVELDPSKFNTVTPTFRSMNTKVSGYSQASPGNVIGDTSFFPLTDQQIWNSRHPLGRGLMNLGNSIGSLASNQWMWTGAITGAAHIGGTVVNAGNAWFTGMENNRFNPFAQTEQDLSYWHSISGTVPVFGGLGFGLRTRGVQRELAANKAAWEDEVGEKDFNRSYRASMNAGFVALDHARGLGLGGTISAIRTAGRENVNAINDKFDDRELQLTREYANNTRLPRSAAVAAQQHEIQKQLDMLPGMRQAAIDQQNKLTAAQEEQATRVHESEMIGLRGENKALGMDLNDKLGAARQRLSDSYDKEIKLNEKDAEKTKELTEAKKKATDNLNAEFDRTTGNMAAMGHANNMILGGNIFGGNIAAIKATYAAQRQGLNPNDPLQVKRIAEINAEEQRMTTGYTREYTNQVRSTWAQSGILAASAMNNSVGAAQIAYNAEEDRLRDKYGAAYGLTPDSVGGIGLNQTRLDVAKMQNRQGMIQFGLGTLTLQANTQAINDRFYMRNHTANVREILAGRDAQIAELESTPLDAADPDYAEKKRARDQRIESIKANAAERIHSETGTMLFGGNGSTNRMMFDYVSAQTQQEWRDLKEAKALGDNAGPGGSGTSATGGSPADVTNKLDQIWKWLQSQLQ